MQTTKKFLIQQGIAILALIVSVVTGLATYRQQIQVNAIETGYFRSVEARLVPNIPITQLPLNKLSPSANDEYLNDMSNPGAVVAVWVEIKVTNTGLRTFSIDSVHGGFPRNNDYNSGEFGTFGYPELDKNFRTPSQTDPITLPVPIASGEQLRFYRQLIFPVAPGVAKQLRTSKALSSDPGLVILNSLEENELADRNDPHAPKDLPFFAYLTNDTYMNVLVKFADPPSSKGLNFSIARVTIY